MSVWLEVKDAEVFWASGTMVVFEENGIRLVHDDPRPGTHLVGVEEAVNLAAAILRHYSPEELA